MVFTKKEFFSQKSFFAGKQFFQKNISIYKNCTDIRYNEHWMIFIERKGDRTHERTSLIFRYTLLSVEEIFIHLDFLEINHNFIPIS